MINLFRQKLSDDLVQRAEIYAREQLKIAIETVTKQAQEKLAAERAKTPQRVIDQMIEGKITSKQRPQKLQEAFAEIDQNILKTPKRIQRANEMSFIQRCQSNAFAVAHYVTNGTPEMIAAIFLVAHVDTPEKRQEVRQKFGNKVTDIALELGQILSSSDKRGILLITASDDLKKLYGGVLINQMNIQAEAMLAATAMLQGEYKNLPDGYEKRLFNSMLAIRGVDPKLDDHLVTAFNRLMARAAHPFCVQVTDGTLRLVENNVISFSNGYVRTPYPRIAPKWV